MRWVRSLAREMNIDPARVAVCGGSAGAHLAAMVAATEGVREYEGDGGHREHSSRADLAILFNGEFDLRDLAEQGRLVESMRLFIGGTIEEMPERYDEISPLKRVHGGMPPALLLHGTDDNCVSHLQSVALAERLREAGVHAEVELCEGKPHAWFNEEPDRSATFERMERFLVSQFGLRRRH